MVKYVNTFGLQFVVLNVLILTLYQPDLTIDRKYATFTMDVRLENY
jgi:hypothetical protein